MHVFRDSDSIRSAGDLLPELAPLLSRRIEELAEYEDYELAELLNVVVIQASDRVSEVRTALGFDFADRLPDAIDAHSGWYELTYVLADDGFGVVLYVPNSPDIDPLLLALCREKASRTTP